MLLSIIIPCFNEEQSLEELIHKSKFLTIDKSIEIIFVNNGSTDNTKIILDNYKKQFSNNIVVIEVKKNIGYGYGIKAGLKISRGKYVSWTHSDLQTDLLDFYDCIKLLKKQNSKYVIIKGMRKNRNFVERVLSKSMELIFSAIFFCNLKEINAQPSIYHKKVLGFTSFAPNDYLFDCFFYIISKKLDFKEFRIPVFFKNRIYGKSKWNFGVFAQLRFSLKNLFYCFKLRKQLSVVLKTLN